MCFGQSVLPTELLLAVAAMSDDLYRPIRTLGQRALFGGAAAKLAGCLGKRGLAANALGDQRAAAGQRTAIMDERGEREVAGRRGSVDGGDAKPSVCLPYKDLHSVELVAGETGGDEARVEQGALYVASFPQQRPNT